MWLLQKMHEEKEKWLLDIMETTCDRDRKGKVTEYMSKCMGAGRKKDSHKLKWKRKEVDKVRWESRCPRITAWPAPFLQKSARLPCIPTYFHLRSEMAKEISKASESFPLPILLSYLALIPSPRKMKVTVFNKSQQQTMNNNFHKYCFPRGLYLMLIHTTALECVSTKLSFCHSWVIC